MYRAAKLLVAPLLVAFAPRAAADVRLPPRSPPARVVQKVGLTRIAVEYDTPAVAGRRIWGGVVSTGAIWRTGAAAAPRITFDREVSLGDRSVAAGTYALLTIPADGAWTVILSQLQLRNREGEGYRPELEVARTRAVAEVIPHRERLTFSFSDFTEDQTWLDLEWETLRVRIPIRVRTNDQIEAEIRALDGFPRRFAEAARYLRQSNPGVDLLRNPRTGSEPPAMGSVQQAGPPPTRKPLPVSDIAWADAGALSTTANISASPAVATVRERHVRVHGPAGTARAPGAAEIGPLVKRGQGAIRACYQRALRQDPSLTEGRIDVSVSIGVSGLVKDVAFSPPHLKGSLEPCIKQAVSRWVFPLSPVEYGTEFPIVLRGRE